MMTLHTEWVQYGQDAQYSGYIARPERAKGTLPAILVIQEIWGVDSHIQELTRRFAAAGYVAMAPDLYARNQSRPDAFTAERVEAVKSFLESVPPTAWSDPQAREQAMNQLPEPARSQVQETFTALFAGLNPMNHIDQLLASTSYLRSGYAASQGQGVASVGYCMGGALSGLLACKDAALKGAVIFYGNAPSEDLLKGIACPIRGFYGELDPRISDAVPGFAKQMEQAGKSFAYQIYPGAHHAFFNDSRASYSAAAARDAFARTISFFNEVL